MIKDEWIARSLGERSSSAALLKRSGPQAKRSLIINHIGPSMNPTLQSGDVLQVIPYDSKKIRCGDVIVFIPPGGDRKITHRVISIDSKGVKTKGDNNKHIDSWVLGHENIIGRAVYLQREKKCRRVYGGLMGQLFVMVVGAICLISSVIYYLLRPVYQQLARAGIFRRWLHGLVDIRVISFNREGRTELQLLMGRHVIGRLLPGKSRWLIKPPFRLLVDEELLSVPNQSHLSLLSQDRAIK
jgi:signal peptidase